MVHLYSIIYNISTTHNKQITCTITHVLCQSENVGECKCDSRNKIFNIARDHTNNTANWDGFS